MAKNDEFAKGVKALKQLVEPLITKTLFKKLKKLKSVFFKTRTWDKSRTLY